jgi:hypothetical protein
MPVMVTILPFLTERSRMEHRIREIRKDSSMLDGGNNWFNSVKTQSVCSVSFETDIS